jgi:pyoverdine/dityrosine biosynthesis protein Dit1
MKSPNTAEVLREEAQKAERLRILLLAHKCKDLEELIKKLEAEDQN